MILQTRLHDLEEFLVQRKRVLLVLEEKKLFWILLFGGYKNTPHTLILVDKIVAFEQLLVLGAVILGDLRVRIAGGERGIGTGFLPVEEEAFVDDDAVGNFRNELTEESLYRRGFQETPQNHAGDSSMTLHILNALRVLQLVLNHEEQELVEVVGLLAGTGSVHEARIEVKDDEVDEVLCQFPGNEHRVHEGLGRVLEKPNDFPEKRFHFLQDFRLVTEDVGVEKAL